jgi:hypothetical protein
MSLSKSELNNYYLLNRDINLREWHEFFKSNGILLSLE